MPCEGTHERTLYIQCLWTPPDRIKTATARGPPEEKWDYDGDCFDLEVRLVVGSVTTAKDMGEYCNAVRNYGEVVYDLLKNPRDFKREFPDLGNRIDNFKTILNVHVARDCYPCRERFKDYSRRERIFEDLGASLRLSPDEVTMMVRQAMRQDPKYRKGK